MRTFASLFTFLFWRRKHQFSPNPWRLYKSYATLQPFLQNDRSHNVGYWFCTAWKRKQPVILLFHVSGKETPHEMIALVPMYGLVLDLHCIFNITFRSSNIPLHILVNSFYLWDFPRVNELIYCFFFLKCKFFWCVEDVCWLKGALPYDQQMTWHSTGLDVIPLSHCPSLSRGLCNNHRVMRGHALRVTAYIHVIGTVRPCLCSFVLVECISNEWKVFK